MYICMRIRVWNLKYLSGLCCFCGIQLSGSITIIVVRMDRSIIKYRKERKKKRVEDDENYSK